MKKLKYIIFISSILFIICLFNLNAKANELVNLFEYKDTRLNYSKIKKLSDKRNGDYIPEYSYLYMAPNDDLNTFYKYLPKNIGVLSTGKEIADYYNNLKDNTLDILDGKIELIDNKYSLQYFYNFAYIDSNDLFEYLPIVINYEFNNDGSINYLRIDLGNENSDEIENVLELKIGDDFKSDNKYYDFRSNNFENVFEGASYNYYDDGMDIDDIRYFNIDNLYIYSNSNTYNINYLGDDIISAIFDNFISYRSNFFDSNKPQLIGPTFIINVDNPLTFDQIISQIVATDLTDGDLTDKIIISENTYILKNGKIDIGTYSFLASVSDNSGNRCEQKFFINVYDVIKPTISASDITAYNNRLYTDLELLDYFNVSDNYDKNVIKEIINNEYSANYNIVGSYDLEIKATDSSDNYSTYKIKINVEDVIAPIINADNFEIGNDRLYTDLELLEYFDYSDDTTAKENLDIELDFSEYKANYNKIGDVNISIKVTDEASNFSIKQIKVHIYDSTKPVITANDKDVSYTIKLSKDEIKALFSVTDESEITYFDIISDDYTSNYDKVGSYMVVVSAKDIESNVADSTILINVIDDIAPVISAPLNLEISNMALLNINEIKNKISVYDKIDGDLDFELENLDNYDVDNILIKDYTFKIKAEDLSGNMASYDLIVKVIDKDIPIISFNSKYIININLGDTITLDEIIDLLIKSGQLEGLTIKEINSNYDSQTPGEYNLEVVVLDDYNEEFKIMNQIKVNNIETKLISQEIKNDNPTIIIVILSIVFGLSIIGVILFLVFKNKNKKMIR